MKKPLTAKKPNLKFLVGKSATTATEPELNPRNPLKPVPPVVEPVKSDSNKAFLPLTGLADNARGQGKSLQIHANLAVGNVGCIKSACSQSPFQQESNQGCAYAFPMKVNME